MKKIELSIPKPCHENWDTMTSGEKGRFCGACQKTVIDFSQMNDRQILDFFKKPVGSVCGHFNQFQLERTIELPKKRLPWVRYFFTISIPAFLFSLKAGAQGEVKLKGRVAVAAKTPNEECKDTTAEVSKSKTIRGKIVDEKGEAVQNASVFLEGTSIGTSTDKAGIFELKHETSEDANVILSCVGFTIKKVTVRELTRNELQVLTLQAAWTGEVVVTGVVVRKAPKPFPLFQPLKKGSAFSHFAVYPNPVSSNSSFTIDTKKIDGGNYLLQIANSTGEVVQSSEIIIDKKVKRFTAQLNPVAAGAYVIRLINKQNNKAFTEMIIVQ